MAQLFTPQPIAPASPLTWESEAAQRRAHALHTRATHAAPKPQPLLEIERCARCTASHRGEC